MGEISSQAKHLLITKAGFSLHQLAKNMNKSDIRLTVHHWYE